MNEERTPVNLKLNTYVIEATKAGTGKVVRGTTEWDGLASIHAVDTESGVHYVSVLDEITKFERLN